MRGRTLGSVGIVVACLVSAGAVAAPPSGPGPIQTVQAPPPRLTPPQLLMPGVALRTAPVQGALRQRVRSGKAQANLAALRQKIVLEAGNAISFKVAGRLQRLVPESTLASTRSVVSALPSNFTRYQDYVGGVSGAVAPPPSRSLKSRQTPVREQGSRGTCTAFAVVAALEAAYAGQDLDLSEQDAWFNATADRGVHSCTDGSFSEDILGSVATHGVAREIDWRYQSRGAMGCPSVAQPPLPTITRPPAAAQNAKWGPAAGRFVVVQRNDGLATDAGAFANNPRLIEAWIAAGYEVMLGARVAAELDSRQVVDVTLGSDGEPLGSVGGHAMLVVGYDRAGGGSVEVKNSWGLDAGTAGYIRLSYDYLRAYASNASVILEVRPVGDASSVAGRPSGSMQLQNAPNFAPSPPPVRSAFAIASELSANRPANAPWRLVNSCVYEGPRTMTANGKTWTWRGTVDVAKTYVDTSIGNWPNLVCNASDCVTLAELPNASYAGAPTPSRRRLEWPAEWGRDLTTVQELIRACAP